MPVVPAELPADIQVLEPGVKLSLMAEHPDLVTPTGIDVDAKGHVWLIACHTHLRPAGYSGPAHDEILVFDAQGKNRRVFYNKTKMTMNIQLGPDGWVYLAERSRIFRVRDSNGDGVGDVEENIAALDTVSDYPHNGLSGMAWHPDGGLVFSLGENFGKDWVLTSADGSKVSGRGEGGVFRCTPDGKKMRRIARGFWNPFGLAVREDGEIFAAENDPGSRPPCRLLNVIEGADYGFQWVYGSAPVHPFVAWNGELRGTLGMIHPCGEGPCSVVPLGGGVMIPSWSNHCIDYFPLKRQGAGFTSHRVELLRGSDFFRPVCMTQGTGQTLTFYLTDWVFSSYPVHARGRLWKLEIDPAKASWMQPAVEPPNEESLLAKALREGTRKEEQSKLFSLAQGTDPVLSDAALSALAREGLHWTPEMLKAMPAANRPWALAALRRVDLSEEKWVRALWNDPDPEVRFECLRWVADAVLVSFKPEVEKALSDPTLNYRLFEATLATWNTLRGEPGAGVTHPDTLLARIQDPQAPASIKAYALRLLPPTHAKVTLPLLQGLLAQNDPLLTLETVRTLAAKNTAEAQAELRRIAVLSTTSADSKLAAITGLSLAQDSESRDLLVRLAQDKELSIREEAGRALRFTPQDPGFAPVPDRPPFDKTASWLARLEALPGKPDAEAGRRLFFHPKVALCATCHRHGGRGNVVGPDLSFVARQTDREGLLRSILEPHREVAPQYYPTQLQLADGTSFIGILLRSSHVDVFRDLTGRERMFKKEEILSRMELKTSLMPPGLVASLTDEEVRDLLAFLSSPSDAPAP